MSELKAMCAAEGFTNIQTYIASGNLVFAAKRPESKVKAALEKRRQYHSKAGDPPFSDWALGRESVLSSSRFLGDQIFDERQER
jgi:hypothetical protein